MGLNWMHRGSKLSRFGNYSYMGTLTTMSTAVPWHQPPHTSGHQRQWPQLQFQHLHRFFRWHVENGGEVLEFQEVFPYPTPPKLVFEMPGFSGNRFLSAIKVRIKWFRLFDVHRLSVKELMAHSNCPQRDSFNNGEELTTESTSMIKLSQCWLSYSSIFLPISSDVQRRLPTKELSQG